MYKKSIYMLSLILISVILLVGCSDETSGAGDGDGEIRELKVVSLLRTDHMYTNEIVPMWIEAIEAEIDNLEIEWTGGPESVPEENLFDSVQNGIVDVSFFLASYARDEVPQGDAMVLSNYTPSEERENGFYDLVEKGYEEKGITYLGRWLSGFGYFFWGNNEIKNLNDFSGLKIRSNPFYRPIINELGGTPIDVAPSEVYTSLERNMVDGFAFPLLGPRNDGWTEVTKYLLNEEFAQQGAPIIMNSESFNQFTEEEQEIIKNVTAEFENDMVNYFEEENSKEFEEINSAGITVIELPEDEVNEFHERVNDAMWTEFKTIVSEEEYEEIQNLLLE